MMAGLQRSSGQGRLGEIAYEYRYRFEYPDERASLPSQFELSVPASGDLVFRVLRRGWFARLRSRLMLAIRGGSPRDDDPSSVVTSGDADFDRAFLVTGNSPGRVAILVRDPAWRAACLGILSRGFTSIERDAGRIRACWADVEGNAVTLSGIGHLHREDGDVVLGVVPRLSQLAADAPAVPSAIAQIEFGKPVDLIAPDGAPIVKKLPGIAAAGGWFWIGGFFYIGWRYGSLATLTFIAFGVCTSLLPDTFARLCAGAAWMSSVWKSYAVCAVRNALLEPHDDRSRQVDTFRFARFAMVDWLSGALVAAMLGGLAIACDRVGEPVVFALLLYFTVGPFVVWFGELVVVAALYLAQTTLAGTTINPFFEPFYSGRLCRAIRDGQFSWSAIAPNRQEIVRACALTLAAPFAIGLMGGLGGR